MAERWTCPTNNSNLDHDLVGRRWEQGIQNWSSPRQNWLAGCRAGGGEGNHHERYEGEVPGKTGETAGAGLG